MNMPYTEEVDGYEVVGVLFAPRSAQFYEFVNPNEHGEYVKVRDPRSDEELVFDNSIAELIAVATQGYHKVTIPIDIWMDFRELYIETEPGKVDGWTEQWNEMIEKDPRIDE